MNSPNPDFLLIPKAIIDDDEIPPAGGQVYGAIYMLFQLEEEKCFASNKKLAEMAGVSRGTAANMISKLAEGKYIKPVYEDKNKKRRKEIVPLIRFGRVSGVSLPNEGGVSSDNERGVSSNNEQRINNTKKESLESADSNPINTLIGMFEPVNPTYKKLFKHSTQRKATQELMDELGYERVESLIGYLPEIQDEKYAPTITTPYQLQQKVGKLEAYLKKEGYKKSKSGTVEDLKPTKNNES